MKTTDRGQNKIKCLPTEYNFYTRQQKQIKALKGQGNIAKILIIGLIGWNIILTCLVISAKQTEIPQTTIPQLTEQQNEEIVFEEYIPPYDLEPIKG